MKNRMKWGSLLLAGAISVASGQEKPPLTARELFYSPPPAATPAPKKATTTERKSTSTKTTAKQTPVTRTPVTDVEAKKQEPVGEPVRVVTATQVLRPLGLRYSIEKRGSDGQFGEVDAASGVSLRRPDSSRRGSQR